MPPYDPMARIAGGGGSTKHLYLRTQRQLKGLVCSDKVELHVSLDKL